MTALGGQLRLDLTVPVIAPVLEPADFAHAVQLAGPRRDRHAATADMRVGLDNPAGALGLTRCRCDRPLVLVDKETRSPRCFKCGRRP